MAGFTIQKARPALGGKPRTIRAGLVGAGEVIDRFAAAAYDLDFKNNAYRGDTLGNMLNEVGNFSGGLYEIESDGSLVTVGGSAIQRTANGLEVWPSVYNQARQNRDLTATEWTKSGLTAARSSGRDGVANSGSRITVTASNGTATLPLLSANSANSRAVGLDVKRVSGAGGISMSIDGGANFAALTPIGAGWSRPSLLPTAVLNPQIVLKFDTAGDVFDIDYVTMEFEGTKVLTPRIATTTASVQRPQNRATSLNKPPLTNFIKANAYCAYWEGKIDADGGRGIFVSDGAFTFVIAADGSGSANLSGFNIPAGTFKFGVYQKIAIRRYVDGTAAVCINGGPVLFGTIPSHAAITHFDVSTNGAGVNNGRGVVKRIAFFNSLSDAEMQAITA